MKRREHFFTGHLVPEIRGILQSFANVDPAKRNDEDLELVQKWLSPMKGMRKFPPEVQKLFLRYGRYERWGIGRTILREGHPCHSFYILLDGGEFRRNI